MDQQMFSNSSILSWLTYYAEKTPVDLGRIKIQLHTLLGKDLHDLFRIRGILQCTAHILVLQYFADLLQHFIRVSDDSFSFLYSFIFVLFSLERFHLFIHTSGGSVTALRKKTHNPRKDFFPGGLQSLC